MFGDVFDNFPSWIVFCTSALFFLFACELGFRAGRLIGRRRQDREAGSTGLVTGSILGLVSFLLAFTFGIAASNFSERRGLVLDEANAIGTAYLRTDLIADQNMAETLRGLMQQYVEDRAAIGLVDDFGIAQTMQLIRESERLQAEMWELVTPMARDDPTPTNALVVSAINDVIDYHTLRVAVGVRHTIPDIIWLALYVISALALGATGYRFGVSFEKRSELLPGMVIAFTALITLISDLDDPRHGFLKSDQSAMIDLLRTMQTLDS